MKIAGYRVAGYICIALSNVVINFYASNTRNKLTPPAPSLGKRVGEGLFLLFLLPEYSSYGINRLLGWW